MTPAQGSLLPYATPATALASCRQVEAITLTIAPELTARQCFDLQCALSYVTLLLEQRHLAARIPPRTIANRPETVLLYVRDLSRQIVTIAADLTQLDCLTLLEQLVHVTTLAERISETIRTGAEWQARQRLPELPTPTLDLELDRLEEARQWRAVRKPIVYQRTQSPAWPDLGFVSGRRRHHGPRV
ncbi:MAG TPA: hypothetical protein VI670_28205 [Thermoanaerobaculia bacterium]|jgi:hypothetical protein